jgi:hypothetical protein
MFNKQRNVLLYVVMSILIKGYSCTSNGFNLNFGNLMSANNSVTSSLLIVDAWIIVHSWMPVLLRMFCFKRKVHSYIVILGWEFFEMTCTVVMKFYAEIHPDVLNSSTIGWFGESLLDSIGDIVQGTVAIELADYIIRKSGWDTMRTIFEMSYNLGLKLFVFITLMGSISIISVVNISVNINESLNTTAIPIGFYAYILLEIILLFILKSYFFLNEDYFKISKKKRIQIECLFGNIIFYISYIALFQTPFVFSTYIVYWTTTPGILFVIYIMGTTSEYWLPHDNGSIVVEDTDVVDENDDNEDDNYSDSDILDLEMSKKR